MADRARTCTRCGSTASGEWIGGVCPACTLEFGLHGYDEAGTVEPASATSAASSGFRGFGDYVLLEEIGAGGMGVVYRALQVSLDRVVALKTIRAGVLARENDLQRFRAEAETAARLRHPNIVAIHEVGECGSQPYFVMEYVEGTSLSERVREGPVAPQVAARYLRVIAEAIEHAHRQGVLHRDLKPSNLIVDTHDRPRVLDFGLAKLAGNEAELTASGAVLGSPAYLPPERATGAKTPPDARGDVYALGAVLYELITGRPPFRAPTALETLRLVAETEPVPPRSLNPHLPRDLETICLKCLAKSPDDRYPTAAELAAELRRFQDREPIRARPTGRGTRVLLWARRKPAIAALSVACLATLLAGIGGISHAWRRERNQRLRAEAGERRALLHLYAADMNLALQAMEEGSDGRARDLLAPYDREAAIPAATGPWSASPRGAAGQGFDPRGFEWRYLRHGTRADPHRRLAGHRGQVGDLALGAEGQTLYSAGADGWVLGRALAGDPGLVWSNRFGFHVSSLALHPNGRVLAVGGDSTHPGVLTDWDGARRFALPAGSVQTTAFSPDGGWLLAGSLAGWGATDGSVAILDLRGNVVRRLPAAGGHVAFAPDGRRFATGSARDRIKLWTWSIDPTSALPDPVEDGGLEAPSAILAMEFSPDGRRLAAVNLDGTLEVWDLGTPHAVGKARASEMGAAHALAFSPDGRHLATGGDDRRLRVWSADTLALEWTHRGHASALWKVLWSADGQSLVSSDGDGAVHVWPARPPPPREDVVPGVTAGFHHCALALSPDSRWFSMGLKGGDVGLWNAATGALMDRVRIEGGAAHAAFAADSAALFVAEGVVRVRRLAVPGLVERGRVEVEPVPMPVLQSELSPEGRWLAGNRLESGREGAIHLWDARSGRLVATLEGHSGRVLGMRFSDDHRWLASGSVDETARLWDLETFRSVAVLRGAANAVTVLSFAPDGRTLATGGWDGVVRLWKVPTGELLRSVPSREGVPVPEFLPDGRTLGIATESGGIRLLNLETWRDVCTLRGPGVRIYRYVRCSPDGRTIVANANDGRLWRWRAPEPAD